MSKNTDPGFEQFMVRYDNVTGDPEVRKQYDMFMGEKFRISAMLNMQLETGILRGIEEGKIEDARNMLLKGYPLSDIIEITHLPIETIREIKLNL
ncbi:MAG: hypothetical protein LBM87_06635 [Ruminococcus sp.]|jgi:hypothetical protein|nr:hypothetical protein [Ruminococcus sp.]